MAVSPSVLYVELVMSIDRIIDASRTAVPEPDGWPPQVIVSHVSDVDEQVWTPRIDLMVDAFESGDAAPQLEWWEPDGEATLARYATSTLDEAAARAMATRIALLTRLRAVTPEQWDGARAEHAAFGTMDLEALVLATLAHDEEHRATLVL